MKKIALVMLICSLLGCGYSKNDKSVDDEQIADILAQALLISNFDSDEIFLFHYYVNQNNVDSLIAFYHYGSNIFGYEIKDSIINEVTKQTDNIIPQSIKNYLEYDIIYFADTIAFDKTCTFITEPFFIDDNKLLFFLSNKKNNSIKSWMYFLEKRQKDSFKVISFFDFQKNKLYMQGKL
jgi:hypothetical protein